MVQDAYLTKTLTTSGASAQFPTGVITNGGSAVDEWDLGLLSGAEPLYLFVNITAVSGTNTPTFTPSLVHDDEVAFGSAVVWWSCPVAITATGLYEYKLPACRERYARFSTGSIGGTNPVFTMTVTLTTTAPHGRLT